MYDYIQAGMEKIEKRKQGNRYEGNKKETKRNEKAACAFSYDAIKKMKKLIY